MPHTWTTKFQPGDKVIWCWNNTPGTVAEVRIMFPDGEDMDYWRQNLPKISGDNYQHTSYLVKLGNGEYTDVAEGGLKLAE